MKILLSLPPSAVDIFHGIEKVDENNFFCTSDPINKKLGSGGGTTWLLNACKEKENHNNDISEWLSSEKRILIHAGGESRRLPSYASSGKILIPMPIFDWERGQKLEQNLLTLQIPLYNEILNKAPTNIHTLIASGDVYIRSEYPIQKIPEADIICIGLSVNSNTAIHHGIFLMKHNNPTELDYMIQKPTIDTLERLSKTHYYLMDVGIWLFSDRAVKLLMQRSYSKSTGDIVYYDMYSEYGAALGANPQIKDKELNNLSVAILPMHDGEFYHYGTNKDLLLSTLRIQNKEQDQRRIIHQKIKPNPAIFVQNSITPSTLYSDYNENLWIENSYINNNWKLGKSQIITGVPINDWSITIPNGICLDIVPINKQSFAARVYGFKDMFNGGLCNEKTLYQNIPFKKWLENHHLNIDEIEGDINDIQKAKIFPVTNSIEELGILVRWMISNTEPAEEKMQWKKSVKLSANDLLIQTNLNRLYEQRKKFRKENWKSLADNYQNSIFYQLDLIDVAEQFNQLDLNIPASINGTSQMTCIHNRMLRAYLMKLRGNKDYKQEEQEAFTLLRDGLLNEIKDKKTHPHLNIYSDQIVWGRCPVRIDVAGGWTDTPPYALYKGGNVVNLAIELNGQPPLQVYVKPCRKPEIILRSIDMSAMEVVTNYQELFDYQKIGSPFSIPKAALTLAGFIPSTHSSYKSLKEQLIDFGGGLEITLLAAIPAGSGLGTSSILASTILGALNDFCGLQWDKNEICDRTLILEQLLTTGGGWQDQYGGVLQGVKLLQSEPGFNQQPLIRWLPDNIFTIPEYIDCHLLYYTGITRTAKNILSEIVCSMFLNSNKQLRLLDEMKIHALEMKEAISRNEFMAYGRLVSKSWIQNKQLDKGTNPPAIEKIINRIKDYTLGYKLPGAGGGGYLYIVAKDPQAAQKIKKILSIHAPNKCARFVNMTLSHKGFQVSRS